MTREIKFRAWDKENESMYSVMSLHWNEGILMQPEDTVLMQFTGLKDKNGKEIYEGDIVKHGLSPNFKVIEWVDRENQSIGFNIGQSKKLDKTREVIGNIYENPELIK